MNQQSSLKNVDQTIVRIWAVANLVLLGLSWKLWLPGFSEFPRVPLVDGSVVSYTHYFATVILVAGLSIVILNSGKLRYCAALVAISFGGLFVCNQHCLQPWAWQAFIFATLFACFPLAKAKSWIVLVLISVYFFSAIGKFDYQFVHSLGQEFLDVVLGWLGRSDALSGHWRDAIVLLFPIGELLISIGLMVKPTRKIAAWLAVVLHVALVFILSPLGLNHRWPVLVWNLMSILFVVWLFLLPAEEKESLQGKPTSYERIGTVFAVVILFGPLLRPVQCWDHWLAWGLYSPSNSRVEIMVSDTALDRMREPFTNYIDDSTTLFGSSNFALDRWSLDELGVPIYPQSRFQKVAAIRWLRRNELLDQATVVEYGPSHPWSGERTKRMVRLPGD